MSEAPRVSVVLPVYDADPGYLREAIESVTAQTFHDLELIVVEDESPRSAAPVVAAARDARVRHVLHPRGGRLGAALNFGLGLSRGPLVARMDADDVCEPGRLAAQVAAFDRDPSLDLLGSQISVIDARGAASGYRSFPLEHNAIVRALRRCNCFSHPSVMFRASTVRRVGGYLEGIAHEDYDLWCRLARAGARMANHPERLVRYRFHAGALKCHDVRTMLVESIRVKERYFPGELGLGDRARIAAEWGLTALPTTWVIRLLAALEYHQLRAEADRSRS